MGFFCVRLTKSTQKNDTISMYPESYEESGLSGIRYRDADRENRREGGYGYENGVYRMYNAFENAFRRKEFLGEPRRRRISFPQGTGR